MRTKRESAPLQLRDRRNDTGTGAALGVVHVAQDHVTGLCAEQGGPDLGGAVGRTGITQDTVTGHLVSQRLRNLHRQFIIIGGAGTIQLGPLTGNRLDLAGVQLDLFNQFGCILCAVDTVDRTAVDRSRLVPQPVVGDLEQRVGGQLPEQLRIGVDPAGIDEQRGRDLLTYQKIHQPGIDTLAPGTAAGIQRQGNNLLVGNKPGAYSGDILTPLDRFSSRELCGYLLFQLPEIRVQVRRQRQSGRQQK